MITHYDLFAGIGGFSLALDEVFYDRPIRHIFCEWEQFPTAVLKQHWPDGEYWGDIAELVADTRSARLEEKRACKPSKGSGRSGQSIADTKHKRLERSKQDKTTRHTGQCSGERGNQTQDWTILTGGFPCQPFSAAGRRKGTADDRYKWPEMFEVIRNVKPEWVIAENVRGLVTWNDGMVLEQVCTDLEAEGYEVQPFIIPAVAVNAPHRRDRVWIIANRSSERREGGLGLERKSDTTATEQCRQDLPDWDRQWQEVAFATCNDAMDDGIPRIVDGFPQSFAKWRQNSLKAYGNGIVHQVAIEILRAVREAQEGAR